jgi:hypothetical protein
MNPTPRHAVADQPSAPLTAPPKTVFTDADLPLDAVDGNGGVMLQLARASSVYLSTEGLRCLDLISCPKLETVDLRGLTGNLHVTVRGCPALRTLWLPPAGAAHVHVDAGEAPPAALSVTGGVEQFDACWGASGRFLRRVSPRQAQWTSLIFASGAEALTRAVDGCSTGNDPGRELLVLVELSPADLDAGHVAMGAGQVGACHVCVVDASPSLKSLEWVGGPLEELSVEGAPCLMVLRVRVPVKTLTLTHCDLLRAVTTEGAACQSVTLRNCCRGLDDGAAPLRPAHGLPRKRSLLVVDAPCSELTLSDVHCRRLRVHHACTLWLVRCQALRLVRAEPGCHIRCEGCVPANLLDHLDDSGGTDGGAIQALGVTVDEGLLRDLAAQVLAGHRAGWRRFRQVLAGCQTPRARSAALQVMRLLAQSPVCRDELWAARMVLYRAQFDGRDLERWTWQLNSDLELDGYRDDFLVWAACSEVAHAYGFSHSMASELIGPGRTPAREALLPWLFRFPVPQAHAFLEGLLRRAARRGRLPTKLVTSCGEGLPLLVQCLAQALPTMRRPERRLMEAARAFYLNRGREQDVVAWLAFEARLDRAGTQAKAAALLQQPANPAQCGWSAQHRAALSVLMLTGSLPGSEMDHPAAA